MTKEGNSKSEKERIAKAVRRVAGKKGKAKPKKEEKNSPEPHKNGLPKGPGKNPCACGCGGTTNSTFQQGHDTRVYSVLRRINVKRAKVSDLPEAVRTNKKLLTSMKAKVH